ncbi:unnamed protein product [Amoebophrya sp. A120]|nr:unnamed protein product [Amoebophrya sp. A120]|eukprot:GSA120T00020437001.1
MASAAPQPLVVVQQEEKMKKFRDSSSVKELYPTGVAVGGGRATTTRVSTASIPQADHVLGAPAATRTSTSSMAAHPREVKEAAEQEEAKNRKIRLISSTPTEHLLQIKEELYEEASMILDRLERQDQDKVLKEMEHQVLLKQLGHGADNQPSSPYARRRSEAVRKSIVEAEIKGRAATSTAAQEEDARSTSMQMSNNTNTATSSSTTAIPRSVPGGVGLGFASTSPATAAVADDEHIKTEAEPPGQSSTTAAFFTSFLPSYLTTTGGSSTAASAPSAPIGANSGAEAVVGEEAESAKMLNNEPMRTTGPSRPPVSGAGSSPVSNWSKLRGAVKTTAAFKTAAKTRKPLAVRPSQNMIHAELQLGTHRGILKSGYLTTADELLPLAPPGNKTMYGAGRGGETSMMSQQQHPQRRSLVSTSFHPSQLDAYHYEITRAKTTILNKEESAKIVLEQKKQELQEQVSRLRSFKQQLVEKVENLKEEVAEKQSHLSYEKAQRIVFENERGQILKRGKLAEKLAGLGSGDGGTSGSSSSSTTTTPFLNKIVPGQVVTSGAADNVDAASGTFPETASKTAEGSGGREISIAGPQHQQEARHSFPTALDAPSSSSGSNAWLHMQSRAYQNEISAQKLKLQQTAQKIEQLNQLSLEAEFAREELKHSDLPRKKQFLKSMEMKIEREKTNLMYLLDGNAAVQKNVEKTKREKVETEMEVRRLKQKLNEEKNKMLKVRDSGSVEFLENLNDDEKLQKGIDLVVPWLVLLKNLEDAYEQETREYLQFISHLENRHANMDERIKLQELRLLTTEKVSEVIEEAKVVLKVLPELSSKMKNELKDYLNAKEPLQFLQYIDAERALYRQELTELEGKRLALQQRTQEYVIERMQHKMDLRNLQKRARLEGVHVKVRLKNKYNLLLERRLIQFGPDNSVLFADQNDTQERKLVPQLYLDDVLSLRWGKEATLYRERPKSTTPWLAFSLFVYQNHGDVDDNYQPPPNETRIQEWNFLAENDEQMEFFMVYFHEFCEHLNPMTRKEFVRLRKNLKLEHYCEEKKITQGQLFRHAVKRAVLLQGLAASAKATRETTEKRRKSVQDTISDVLLEKGTVEQDKATRGRKSSSATSAGGSGRDQADDLHPQVDTESRDTDPAAAGVVEQSGLKQETLEERKAAAKQRQQEKLKSLLSTVMTKTETAAKSVDELLEAQSLDLNRLLEVERERRKIHKNEEEMKQKGGTY